MQKMTRRSKNEELKDLAKLERVELFQNLKTNEDGLTATEAEERLEKYGMNIVAAQQLTPWYMILWHAIRNPFIAVLAFLAIVSFVTGSAETGAYMCVMISLSAGVSFVQEYKSQKASIELREMIENTTAVRREGKNFEIPMDEVVPGDIIHLQTGDMIPADAVLLSSRDLFINQASLTGESFPVEKKRVEDLDEDEQIDWDEISALDAPNILFMGTDVLSGNGEILIVKTGAQTMFGDIANKSSNGKITSSFEVGLSRVSRVLLYMVAVMFPVVFLINWLTKGATPSSATDAFFFAIAVAVGLTPEMLPMIVNTNLAKGAVALSKEKVIVKRLSAIQNLGSMNILCTDKTGTITEDRVVMMDYVNSRGEKVDKVLNTAYINSYYQTGWKNLMDVAIINYFEKDEDCVLPYQSIEKVDEIPFDFSRRLLSVVVKVDGRNLLITKGAVEEMQAICTHVLVNGERLEITAENLEEMRAVNLEMNENGMRVLTVAQRILTDDELEDFDKEDERDMTLVGFLGFLDPAKPSAGTAIKSLQENGVTVKVLTGDNAVVAQKVCEEVGIDAEHYMLGTEIDNLSDEELYNEALHTHLFAKLNPMQKARIIELLRKVHTVGFMGDGINDAPALRAADIGISVDTAADITKDASSIILLEKSLQVLETGVIEGRKVFSNMMKYIRITLSSNFGNVFSVLVASAFLPFLPMLSIQILTLNLIYDMSQLTVPWDHVDEDTIKSPVKWGTRGLLRFAITIGPISSIFDITTFIVLWFIFGYHNAHLAPFFQAGWFAESLATQSLAFHILRTKKIPFLQSRASLPVYLSTVGAFTVGALIMFTPIGEIVQMPHQQPLYWIWWIVIIICYILLLQAGKVLYYKRVEKNA